MGQSAAFKVILSSSRVEQAIINEIERLRRPERSYKIARDNQYALVAAASHTFQTIRSTRYRGRPRCINKRDRGYCGNFWGSRGHRGGYRRGCFGRGGYAKLHRYKNHNQACFRCRKHGHFVRLWTHDSDIGGRTRGINRTSRIIGENRVRRGKKSSGNHS